MNQSIQKLLIIVVLLGLSIAAIAQTKTVTGIISDDKGPLIGAAVVIDGSNKGVTADIDGSFSIVVEEKDFLVFSYMGYISEKVAVAGKTEINVTLKEDLSLLEELVVVGYGVQKKSHLTGSITKYKADEAAIVPTADITNALNGRLAGVSIQNTTGEVGAPLKISVRGGSALNDGSSPLIVVDNFVMEDGLSLVNSSDIESIEVLKDASSAAIYGSRAANGVIMITTKQGQEMKPRYTARYSFGMRGPYKLHDVLSPGEYGQIAVQEYELGGRKPYTDDLANIWLEERLPKQNWQQYGLTPSPMVHDAQLYVSGGRQNLKYAVSGGFISEEGIIKNNSVDKFNFRSRLDIKLSDYVDIGTSISAAYVETERPTTNFLLFTYYPEWMPVNHTEATSELTGYEVGTPAHPRHFYIDYPVGENGAMVSGIKPYNSTSNNPSYVMDKSFKKYDTYSFSGNFYINVNILPNLVLRSANSANIRYATMDTFSESNTNKDGELAHGTFKSTLRSNLVTDNTLSWDEKFGVHGINLMAGISLESTNSKIAEIDGEGFPTDYIQWLIAATSFNPDGTGVYVEPKENLFSYFGRANYSILDRYLLSAVFRADGYSLFGKNNKWGYFPSVSLGWRISEEPWMQNAKDIDEFKFRVGYGLTGDNKVNPLATLNLLYTALYPIGGGTGNITPGLANIGDLIGNPDLGWAKVQELNIGLDMAFLKNRVSFSLDYYYSITSDMLFMRPVSSISGHKNFWTNEGKIRNYGVELNINSFNIDTKDFVWSTQFNISTDKNRLLSLGGEAQIINTAGTKESYISRVGDKAIQFYGYKTDGVWMSQEDIDNGVTFSVAGNDAPGGLKVVDVDGNGVINTDDMTVIGDPYHDFQWGMTNTFEWKGLQLSFLFQGAHGGQMINGDGFNIAYKERNVKWGIYDRWKSETHPGDGKTPLYGANTVNWMLTDYVVEDASYVALRNVNLAYSLPKKVVKKMKIDGLKIYLNGDNLGFFTPKGYRGINTEYRRTSGEYENPLIAGYQRGGFPITTTISAGIEIKF